jgi:sulfur carrier protein ThiS
MKKTVKKEVDTLEVIVLRFGGRPQRVQVEEGTSVQDAIDEAGFTVKPNDEVTVNGETVDKDELSETEITDADRVVITPRFEGGVK